MMNPSADCLLDARNIGRRGDGDQWLLRDVSLEISGGERLAVAGPTGSGKTVLLRALALLDPIDRGEIQWQGRPIANVPMYRRQVMYLHQRPALFPGSVEENLRLPYSFGVHRGSSYKPDEIRHRLSELQFDASFLAKSATDLSGGEAQIVTLLRALQLNPTVMLLDEPTASLDADAAKRVETVIQRWLDDDKNNRAYIWVSHNQEQSSRMADRVFDMTAKGSGVD